MAEISVVASIIFGVAAFGTNVAKSLYETGDVMIHAHQQIASMAKHVSQFTAVLRHLGRVLEAEKGTCSKDLLHDIKKLQRSCKRTFKEINTTIRPGRLRSFISVRWLFKKSKAKELEARLDSSHAFKNCAVPSKQPEQRIIGHIFLNLTWMKGPQIPSPTLSTNGSGSPGSDNEAKATESMFGEPEPQLSPSRKDSERSRDFGGHPQEGIKYRPSAVQPLRTIYSTPQSVMLQTSSILLQTILYRPISSNPVNHDRSGHLITFRPSIDNRFEDDANSPMEEATKSVRLLLDKWTTSGSAPIDAILNEEQAEDNIKSDVWKGSQYPNHDDGDILLSRIRSTAGGINYMKMTDCRWLYYVDSTVIHTFHLVPPELINCAEPDPLFTEIGRGWVRQEVLDLLGYSYSETRPGHYSITSNLDLVREMALE
ncbi:MAG: hypothetical protein Q9195_007162 [Heterodermia aff. obscurata]